MKHWLYANSISISWYWYISFSFLEVYIQLDEKIVNMITLFFIRTIKLGLNYIKLYWISKNELKKDFFYHNRFVLSLL